MYSVWKQRFSEALRNMSADKDAKGILSALQAKAESQTPLAELREQSHQQHEPPQRKVHEDGDTL